MLEVAAVASIAGADWLCVNQVDEGVALRQAGHEAPILVMGYVELARLGDVVAQGLRPVVYNPETVDRLEALAAETGRQVRVHVKVETGTHRQGVLEPDLPAFAERIRRSPHLVLEGMTTHFANIEDTTDHSMAQGQIAAFDRAQGALAGSRGRPGPRAARRLLGGRPPLHPHPSRPGADRHLPLRALALQETYVSLLERGKPALDLRPVLTWKTRVAQVKDVPEGAYVGYGCTWKAGRNSRIAVLPVGYFEGYDRGLSGIAHVLVRGRRAPVRGRICMNMCMVDVTDIPGVGVEDEVVLLGSQGEERSPPSRLPPGAGPSATRSCPASTRTFPASSFKPLDLPSGGEVDSWRPHGPNGAGGLRSPEP
jgi:alanine racemase